MNSKTGLPSIRPRYAALSENERDKHDAAVAADLRSLADHPREMQAILDIYEHGPAYASEFPEEIRWWLESAAGLEGHGAPLRFDEAGRLAITRVPHVREAVELYTKIARPSGTLEGPDPSGGAGVPRKVAGDPEEGRG